MREYFMYNSITEDQSKFLYQTLSLGLQFINGELRNSQVFRYKDITESKRLFSEDLPKDSMTFDELLGLIKKVCKYSIAQSDQRYIAFPDTGNSVATVAADIINSCINQNLIAVDRSAPVGSFIEAQLILWLRDLIGYTGGRVEQLENLNSLGGMWTSGGNMSNYIAVLTALRNHFPQIKERGLVCLKKRPVMILARGVEHYSFMGAAQALGLGNNGILWAKTKEDFTTDAESIRELLSHLPEHLEPFMIVAVAGNCRTSGIDNIAELKKISQDYNLWLHVDACHGGSLLFSSQLRKYLNGIELADSVSLDPHKGLFVTYSSSYILFKRPKDLGDFGRYPEKVASSNCFDLGLITPFYGSRGFESLKLWLLIKHMGVQNLGKAVESREKLFFDLVDLIDKTGLFVFLNDPGFYRLSFVFYPKVLREKLKNRVYNTKILYELINKYTYLFSQNLYKSGSVILDLFSLTDFGNRIGLGKEKKYKVLGMSIGHPFMEESIRQEIYEKINAEGIRCMNQFVQEMTGQLADKNEKFECLKPISESPASW